MNELNITQVKEMFAFMADEIMKNETLLTEMDNKIGDGDHGIGMSLGFRAVKENLPNMKADSVNELFKEVGMTMLDAMGSLGGYLWNHVYQRLWRSASCREVDPGNSGVYDEAFSR